VNKYRELFKRRTKQCRADSVNDPLRNNRCRCILRRAAPTLKKNKLPVFSVSLANYEFSLTANRTEYELTRTTTTTFISLSQTRNKMPRLVPYFRAFPRLNVMPAVLFVLFTHILYVYFVS